MGNSSPANFRAVLAAALCCTAMCNVASSQTLETPSNRKPRVVITADPELDDSNSLVRYLLFSSDYDTEGLIYASSQFHWKGDGKGTKWFVAGREYTRFGLNLCPCTSWRWDPNERFIDDAVEAYAAAYPNLRVHDADYPSPELLQSKIRWGNVEFDGDISQDTPGSDLIKSLLLDDDESPVYLHAWGGQSTIARALKSIEEHYQTTPQWAAIRAKVNRKTVIHPSGDQDDTYANYIRPNWPDIRYRQLAGGVMLAYNAQSRVSEADAVYFTTEWTRENISQRGPLGALYRVWGDGKQMVPGDIFDYFGVSAGKSDQELKAQGYVVWTPVHATGSFLGEGDTGTFLNLVDNGLRGYRDESYGGWGGYANNAPARSFAEGFAALESVAANRGAARQVPRAPTHPFLAVAQRELAARFQWATAPRFEDANHDPQLGVRGSRLIATRAGGVVNLRVRPSDPDGDDVGVRWWRWDEADSYAGGIDLSPATGSSARLAVPTDAKPGETIHVVAEATDDGAPMLTRYERFVVTVR
jgi:hypothetical protein